MMPEPTTNSELLAQLAAPFEPTQSSPVQLKIGPSARRSVRLSKHPTRFNDYLCYSAQPSDPSLMDSSSLAHPCSEGSFCTHYPIAHYATTNKFPASYQHFSTAITWIIELKFFYEAMKVQSGTLPWLKKLQLLRITMFGLLRIFPSVKNPSVTNGFTVSSIMLAGVFNDIKQDW